MVMTKTAEVPTKLITKLHKLGRANRRLGENNADIGLGWSNQWLVLFLKGLLSTVRIADRRISARLPVVIKLNDKRHSKWD